MRWDRFYRADRDRNDDRIFYYEKRAGGGFRLGVSNHIALTVRGGYAFDRLYFEGKDYNDREENLINIVDTPYGTIKIGARF